MNSWLRRMTRRMANTPNRWQALTPNARWVSFGRRESTVTGICASMRRISPMMACRIASSPVLPKP